MDSLTQGLLGATIAEAGFRSKLGRVGTLLGAGLAILPDFDIIAKVFTDDPFATLRYHRAETHSLPVLTLAAPLLAWGIWRLRRRRERFQDWWLMTWLVLLSAPLLDACTTYGTQLLAPFTRHRYAWDVISIIDIFYSIPLLLAFVLAMLPRIPPRVSQRIAMTALFLTTLYLCLGAWNRSHVLDIVRSLPPHAHTSDATIKTAARNGPDLAEDAQIDFLATPCFTTIWLWRVVSRIHHRERDTYNVYLVSAWTGRIVGQASGSTTTPPFHIRTGVQPSVKGSLFSTPTSGAPRSPATHPINSAYPLTATVPLAELDASDPTTSRPNVAGDPFFYGSRSTPRPHPPLVGNALASETGELLLWFSNGWLTWQSESTETGTRLSFYDLRYGTASAPLQTPFAWVFLYDEAGTKTGVERLRQWNGENRRLGWNFIRDEFRLTWRYTWE